MNSYPSTPSSPSSLPSYDIPAVTDDIDVDDMLPSRSYATPTTPLGEDNREAMRSESPSWVHVPEQP